MDAVHGEEATPTQAQASARATKTLATAISQGRTGKVAESIRKLIKRVDIAPDRLRLTISRAGLAEYAGGTNYGDGIPVILDAPISIRRRGVESKFVLPGTNAEIAALDLVVTVDTAVAHLAGALGKPVWIMLGYTADWRYLLARDDSPWYPTMRLFRQNRPGDWAGVAETVAAEIATWED